ncbi:GxxExxY protein, partial [Myxococcota bacterium]
LGCGFVELMYENALCFELDQLGICVEKQVQVPVVYKDCLEIGVHRLDLLVEEKLILELKAVRAVDAVHYATVRSYLKATGLDEALILNFGLPRLDVRRVVPR